MKRSFLLLLWILQVMLTSGQWVQQYSGTTAHLLDVSFVDNEHGFAVGETAGENGTILKTVDGGSYWEQLDGGINIDWRAVKFLNRDTGYIVGNQWFSGGIILKTKDGGTTWDITELSAYGLLLYDVDFSSPDTGVVVGGLSHTCVIYRTTNGGNDWVQVPVTRNGDLLSVCFPVKDTGYAAGGYAWSYEESNDLIFKTTDAGVTWALIDSMAPMRFSIEFSDANTGYCVGWWGWMHLTTDGGMTWSYQYFPSYDMYGLSFPSHDTGYVLGHSNIDSCSVVYRTIDAGMTWWPLTVDSDHEIASIMFPDKDTGYAVGSYGLILKTEDAGGFPVGMNKHSTQTTKIIILPNPATDWISFDTPAKGDILIYNIEGIVVRKVKPIGPRTKTNVLALPAGMYYVKYSSANGMSSGKFIKQ